MTSIVAPQYKLESLASSITDTETVAKMTMFAFLGNFIGIPGISVPIGYSEIDGDGEKHDGDVFPIGMHTIFLIRHE